MKLSIDELKVIRQSLRYQINWRLQSPDITSSKYQDGLFEVAKNVLARVEKRLGVAITRWDVGAKL